MVESLSLYSKFADFLSEAIFDFKVTLLTNEHQLSY